MLDYDSWQQVKEECRNDAQVSFQRMSEPAQAAMKEADAAGALTEVLGLAGTWVMLGSTYSQWQWHKGNSYRISPSWPGPAKPEPKPEPKPEYVDQPIVVNSGYRVAQPGEDDAHWLISVAHGLVGFCGFVYEADGKDKLNPILIFDQQPDGTHRLRVPKAVRFLKGATV
jgi:hypothetical protein